MRKDIFAVAGLSLLLVLLWIFSPQGGYFLRGGRWNGDAASLASSTASLFVVSTKDNLSGTRAFVYSKYPFGLKNEILVSAGDQEGITVGDTALSQDVFIGVVNKVFGDSSLVTTIFDPSFKAAVRIGSSHANALLVGGGEPKLTLIEAKSSVAAGDPIYSAGLGTNYGLPIGRLGQVKLSEDKLFQEANILLPYSIEDIDSLILIPQPVSK